MFLILSSPTQQPLLHCFSNAAFFFFFFFCFFLVFVLALQSCLCLPSSITVILERRKKGKGGKGNFMKIPSGRVPVWVMKWFSTVMADFSIHWLSGDDDFYPGGSFYINPMDSGLLVSIGSCMDVYCPPRKRSRITAPYIFRENNLELEKRPSIDVLPDECLFEILRRLPGGQERSSCARVSKRWLMLLSNRELGSDGYLTRCLEGKKATDISLAAIAVGTSSRGGLGKLSIRESSSSRGVTNLGLPNCPWLPFSKGSFSVECLSCWDEGLFEIGLIAIAKNCPNLTALTIESCANIGNESLQAIGSLCPNYNPSLSKTALLLGSRSCWSVSSATSILSRVKLQSLNITDFSLAVVGHYGKAITSLTLSGLQNVSEKGFWVMGNAMGLQT
ncbi:EIN3-binding F-box protein 1 [Vitis vinifera]|uniref:EIN3-binding F-box protein 1 n=1 Tax=Vitis vinifera TaxID=29760 RepID=A0A438C0P1_VITVI|nr:EIN3-binding F-box protein 1 [Vitis vinifera]